MQDQIKHQKSFIDKDTALKVSEYAKAHDHLFTDFGNSEKEFTVHTHSDIGMNDSEILNIVNDYAKKVYSFVLDSYPGPFIDFDESSTHIARFSSGKGMHEHFDSSRPNDIATLVYLNDDYDGGEIYFPEYGISIKPEPGDLLTFPDNPNFVHGVRPIISGVRYTTPRWFTRIV
jgi:hypothetical protein